LRRNANAASNFAVMVLLLAAAGRRLRRRAGGCFDRKRFPALAAVTGLSLSVLSSAAEAADQCPQKNSPIDTDRPDVTNSSVVLPQGSFQDENGINLSRHDSDRAFDGTNTRLRWGVVPCLEILVDLPNYVATVSRSPTSGFTDVIPAVKWQIGPLPGQFDLSATVGVGLPTGTKVVAGPGLQPYVQFPWSWRLTDGWSISGMFSNFITPADTANKLSTETTFVLEREFGERKFLFVEYVGDYHEHGGPGYLFNSGGGYRIAPTQQIDFHVGIGLNDNAPAYVFGMGYSFRLDGLF